MLNYIWAGLIIISICSALGHDLNDEWSNRYDNGKVIKMPFTQTEDDSLIKLHVNNTIIPAHWKNNQKLQLIIPDSNERSENW